jgi:hypothetical protein
VIDRKPGFVEYVAARKSFAFPREKDSSRMLEYFRRQGAGYVVLSALPYDDIGRYLKPALDAQRRFFIPLLELRDPYTYVLRFDPNLTTPGEAGNRPSAGVSEGGAKAPAGGGGD